MGLLPVLPLEYIAKAVTMAGNLILTQNLLFLPLYWFGFGLGLGFYNLVGGTRY